MARNTIKKSMSDRAIERLYEAQKATEPTDAFVRSEIHAFNGHLLTLTFKTKDGKLLDNYFFADGRDDHYFFNSNELARFLDSINKKYSDESSIFREIVKSGGTTSIVAICITLVICYLAIQRFEIPEILGHALTTILGFYFGSKISARVTSPPSGK